MSRVETDSNPAPQRRFERRPARRVRASAARAAAASGVLLMLLSGCALGGDPEHYSIFDAPPGPADVLPPDFAEQELDGLDLDSLRFAAEYQGDHLYLARGSDPRRSICLLVDGPEDGDASMGCSGGSWVVVQRSGGHAYHVHPDAGVPLPDDDDTDLTANISVKAG